MLRFVLSALTILLILAGPPAPAATVEPLPDSAGLAPVFEAPLPLFIFGEGLFSKIDGVRSGADGRIYVADKLRHEVFIFDERGGLLRRFGRRGTGDGEFNQPTGLAFDRRGRLVVVDQNNARVQVFTADGSFLFRFGENGSEPGQFIEPQGIAVDRHNRYLVTDTTRNDVQVFDHRGKRLGGFGGTGDEPGSFNGIESIIVDNQDRILVSDEGHHRLQLLDYTGRHLRTLGSQGDGPGRFVKDAEGIAQDESGLIYALDESGGELELFDAQGECVGTVRLGRGSAPGQLLSPDGIEVDEARDRLLISDQGNRRVQVFSLSEIKRRLARGVTVAGKGEEKEDDD